MPGLYSRIKTWIRNETLAAADVNAEFDNIKTNFIPSMMDDQSTNTAAMRAERNPGGVGSESLATSLAEEIQSLRYAIRRALGTTYWYENPGTSLVTLEDLLQDSFTVPANRIVSGRVDSNNQPMFLVANGAGSVKLEGAPTAFRCYINNTLVEQSADLTLTGLTGPTAFACQLDDATAAAGQSTKTLGENDTTITIDTPTGTPPTVGSMQVWKRSTEYFLAVYASTTTLTKAMRGAFFDSSDASLARQALTNNDSFTMCRLAYCFFTYQSSVAALTSTYNRPIVAKDQPTGSSSGDFWFDTSAGIWKTYNGSAWIDSVGIFVGLAVIDGTNTCVAARSADFTNGFQATDTLRLEKLDNATIQNKAFKGRVNVYGSAFEWINDYPIWDMSVDLDSGVTEGASTTYYFYITDLGDTIISDVAPHDRRMDLLGFYHPSKPWRAIGYAANDGSSNLGTPSSYDMVKTDDLQDLAITTAKINDSAVTTDKINDGAVTPAKKASLGQIKSTTVVTAFLSTDTNYVDITNLTLSITTTGRPVFIGMIPDVGVSLASILFQDGGDTAAGGDVKFLRDASTIGIWHHEIGGASGNQASVMHAPWTIDTPGAGTYTYKGQVRVSAAGDSVTVNGYHLIAFEL